jgi:DNA-binding GntR family transcriptional regulator
MTVTASKSTRAYDYIAARIADGRYSPGYRLVLGQIAQELDVSVVPVREAIRRLQAEGLVTFVHNVGAQVSTIPEAEYVATMQTLSIVEGAATALAAPFLVGEKLDAARAINERLRGTLDDFQPVLFTELNREFHAALYELCPNPHLLDLVHRGWARLGMLRRSTFAFVPERAAASVAEHDDLLRLLGGGADPLEIELSARNHRLATMNAFLDHEGVHHSGRTLR